MCVLLTSAVFFYSQGIVLQECCLNLGIILIQISSEHLTLTCSEKKFPNFFFLLPFFISSREDFGMKQQEKETGL